MTLAAIQAPAPQAPRATASQRAAERIRVAAARSGGRWRRRRARSWCELRRFEVERQLQDRGTAADSKATAATHAAGAGADRARGRRRCARRRTTERPEIEGRLVRVYKLGQAGFWRLLLDVDDLRSAGRAYRTAAALTRIDRDRVVEHQRTLEALAREQAGPAAARSRSSRSSRPRRAPPARRPTRLCGAGPRWSRRSTPAAT